MHILKNPTGAETPLEAAAEDRIELAISAPGEARTKLSGRHGYVVRDE
jgi:hypothetical protein